MSATPSKTPSQPAKSLSISSSRASRQHKKNKSSASPHVTSSFLAGQRPASTIVNNAMSSSQSSNTLITEDPSLSSSQPIIAVVQSSHTPPATISSKKNSRHGPASSFTAMSASSTSQSHTPAPGDYSGWLFKWTNYLKRYKKRWFVLHDGYLSYYRSARCTWFVMQCDPYCHISSPQVEPSVLNQ